MTHPLPALSELIEVARWRATTGMIGGLIPLPLIERAECELFGIAAEITAIDDDCARALPFHLSPLQRKLLWLIARRSPARPYLSTEGAYRALYGSRHESDQPDPRTIGVFLNRIRAVLPAGIEIETRVGTGYRMPPASRAAFFRIAGVTE